MKTIQIKGDTYVVSQLTAMAGLRMFNRLGRILGPGMAAVAGALRGTQIGKADVADIGQAIAPGLADVFARLSDDELEKITRDLLYNTTRNGKLLMDDSFELVMAGQTDVIFELLKFAIEVNYGNFLGKLLRRAVPAEASAAGSTSPTSSPTT